MEDNRYYNAEEAIIFGLGHALFPLTPFVVSRAVKVWGGAYHVFNATAACGALRVAQWISANPHHSKYLRFGKTCELGPKSRIVEPLTLACTNGHLDFAQWLAKRYELGDTVAGTSWRTPFPLANAVILCSFEGDNTLVQWLLATFSNILSDNQPQSSKAETIKSMADQAFEGAFQSGSFQLVKTIYHKYFEKFNNSHTMNSNEDLIKLVHKCISRACLRGYTGIVEWAINTFPCTSDKYVGQIQEWIYEAVAMEHFDLVQWLFENIDCEKIINSPLYPYKDFVVCAVLNNHISLAIWLLQKVKPPSNETINLIFPVVCTKGMLDVAKWVNLCWIIERTTAVNAFKRSFGKEHLEIVRWLAETFLITAADIVPWDPLLEAALFCEPPSLTEAEWLVNQYQLQISDVWNTVFFAAFQRLVHLADLIVWVDQIFHIPDSYFESNFLFWVAIISVCIMQGNSLKVRWVAMRPLGSELREKLGCLFLAFSGFRGHFSLHRDSLLHCRPNLLEDLQWTVGNFNVSTETITKYQIFQRACYYTSPLPAIFLADRFNISKDEACCHQFHALRNICSISPFPWDFAEWFVTKFAVTVEDVIKILPLLQQTSKDPTGLNSWLQKRFGRITV